MPPRRRVPSDFDQSPPAGAEEGQADLVVTPGGWRPKSETHRLEPGQHISGKGARLRIIETATGKVVKDLGPSSKPKHGRSN
jgi:hypothetical protein